MSNSNEVYKLLKTRYQENNKERKTTLHKLTREILDSPDKRERFVYFIVYQCLSSLLKTLEKLSNNKQFNEDTLPGRPDDQPVDQSEQSENVENRSGEKNVSSDYQQGMQSVFKDNYFRMLDEYKLSCDKKLGDATKEDLISEVQMHQKRERANARKRIWFEKLCERMPDSDEILRNIMSEEEIRKEKDKAINSVQ